MDKEIDLTSTRIMQFHFQRMYGNVYKKVILNYSSWSELIHIYMYFDKEICLFRALFSILTYYPRSVTI